MALSLDSLDLLPPTGGEGGTPLRIPLDTIDEDPDQPRQEFDEQSLTELAETIRERGVRQPVSVRTHPTQSGRWMLNFGARRLRACKRVGLSEIPAFVDQTANSVDQFIENEQRKGLSPLEIALFVQRALNQGQTQADIARAIGKSRQYVTLATALIDPPDWLMGAYREGRCRGLAELYELRKLAGQHPQYVEAWASDREAITRESVAALRTDLTEGSGSVRRGTSALIETMEASRMEDAQTGATDKTRQSPSLNPESTPRAPMNAPLRLLASLDGVEVALSILQRPAQAGQVYVMPVTGGQMQAVQASRLTLLGWTGT
ncbi:ParB/RepB/Spo0J family partition protein [Hydrogenophaga pseudoflava]|uniref:ParB/RepB/Spo0J family partition protein n=1 Tax=Hydrogenophaga pseudoflava TaxID=47421 RepID=UPI0027E57386|nr:ParB/RepB/Spo0J family partition protein [Hydrogenophaga pseudoflava]MDQ7746345.1 ParB/RepB/Spo0J family partition protein [Hydrogenophaga pseudoflava]